MKLKLHLKAQGMIMSASMVISIMLFSFYAIAQQTFTGKVTDTDGKPLAGASVIVKGDSKRGTTTDEQGFFTFSASKGETLNITMVNFKSSQVTLTDQLNYEIRLERDITSLGEVVMIGYGSAQRKDAVGSISTISGENFRDNSAVMPAELIQGSAAGVQVVRRSGQPGINVHVMIRGSGSFTSVEPLYIIDGIRSEATVFNAIHPQDIENITLLKDASSTSIYGANGANGVVIITTKKGKKGPPVISFSSQWGIATRPKKYRLLNAAQYVDLAKEFQSPLPPDYRGTATDGDDWQDLIYRNAVVSTNHISVSGGGDRMVYNISGGYFDQESVLRDFRFRAANLRVSLQETFGILKLGQDINFQYQHQTGSNDYGHSNSTLRDALAMPPYLKVFDATGEFTAPNGEDMLTEDNPVLNPIARLRTKTHTGRFFILNPQFFGEIKLLKSLTVKSQVSFKYLAHNFSDFQTAYNTGFEDEESEAGEEQFTALGYLLENYATWNKTFGQHHFIVTAGNSYISKGRSSLLVVEASGFPNNSVPNVSVAFDPQVHESTVSYANPSEISYFGRVVYDFANKYILSASFRRDGSSVFGPDNKFGNFPSIGFAWNAGSEKFLEKAKDISNLKFRFSWGKTGNSRGEPFQVSQALFNGDHAGTLIYSLGDEEDFANGITVNRFPNPLLKWEETTETNVGFDLGMFDNSLRISADWYKRKNKDLLVDIPVPNSTGTGMATGGGTILSNAASVVNQGIELQLSWSRVVNPNFHYGLNLNGAYNKNNVLSIGTEFVGQIRGGYVGDDQPTTITRAGDPVGSFIGLQVEGVDKNTGYFNFKDINKDGEINDLDKVILGNPIPKFVYGGNIELGYKNFDVNILLSGAAGLKIYNDVKFTLLNSATLHNVSTDLLSRWKAPGNNAIYPGAFLPFAEENYQPSDFYIENGSYLRVKILSVGYNLPVQTLQRISKNVIKNLRLSLSAENLLTLTPYSGQDVEVSRIDGDIIFSRGLDLGQTPQTRTFLAGIQMTF